jgi:murein DD-endopeptidase MepM/ murein hydrolase activator NlpD
MLRLSRCFEWLREFAHRWFPDRQILVRGSGRIATITISQRRQIAAAGAALAAGVWLATATVATAFSWQGQARQDHTAAVLRAELRQDQARLVALSARDKQLAQDRAQALNEAHSISAAALAEAAAARAEAAAQTTALQEETRAQLDALNAQTQATIGGVESLIRSTGLNPSRFVRSQPPARFGPVSSIPEGASLLRRDLGQLQSLSRLLGHIPLAAPVADMSISSPFGYRADPFTGAREFHVGIDLRGPIGSPVYATAPGTVIFAGGSTGYGRLVIIDHGFGLTTRYSHLDRILVRVGEPVSLHQQIGLMGNTGWSTGPHLLYETRVDGTPQNPLNFIKSSDVKVSQNDVQN